MKTNYEIVTDYVENELNVLLWDHLMALGIIDEYINNCVITIITEDPTERDVNILREAFKWNKTKEGYEFWNKLDKEYPEFRGIYE